MVDVVREIELDASAEEVWRVVTEPAELAAWLGDEVELDGRRRAVAAASSTTAWRAGRGGRRRRTRASRSRSAGGTTDEGEAGASRVVITVVPSGGPTRLVVRETLCGRPGHGCRGRRRTVRWDVRLVCLAVLVACLALGARVRSDSSDRLDGVLGALADPTRRSLLRAARGPWPGDRHEPGSRPARHPPGGGEAPAGAGRRRAASSARGTGARCATAVEPARARRGGGLDGARPRPAGTVASARLRSRFDQR